MNNEIYLEFMKKANQSVLENILETGEPSFLDDSIATGKVLKLPLLGELSIAGYETGALILEPGAEVKEHGHDGYIETYLVISSGKVIMNPTTAKDEKFNLCKVGDRHFIKNGDDYTVVIYQKTKV